MDAKRFNAIDGKWETVPPEPIRHDGYMTCPEGDGGQYTTLKTYEAHYRKEHPNATA